MAAVNNTLDQIKTGTAVTSPIASFSRFLDGFKDQMALALPKHLNADRVARLVLTAFSQSDQLQKSEPRSIIASVMVASQMGLEIGVSGQGYLIPYYDNRKQVYICTFVPGWQGIVDIVNRSGRASVWTGAVFKGDQFDYTLGDSPYVRHKPCGEDDPDLLEFVYAIGRKSGDSWPVIEVWPISKVQRHLKKYNKVGDKHYAFKHWEMYARKIPLLQVCKYMPKSIELTNAMEQSFAADEGRTIDIDQFVNMPSAAEFNGNTVDATPPPPASPAPGPGAGKSSSAGAQTPVFDEAGYAEKLKACKDRATLQLMGDDIRDEVTDPDAKKRLYAIWEAQDKALAEKK